jgi:DNA invertase Pin-like site-specific DNA recombinase
MVTPREAMADDLADALGAVGALRRLADRVEDAAVRRALADGWSWVQIAQALGVSRQAVHKKHARRVAAATPDRRNS